MYRYGPPLSIDTKVNTIDLHMTSLWRHKVIAPSEIWMHWKYTWKLGKINFSLKTVETWDFRRIKMMILIYIGSLKHITCQIFKKWAKSKSWDFTNSLYHSLWLPTPYQTTPQISPHIHQKMRKGRRNEMITLKRLVQIIGQNSCFKKDLRGWQQPPFGGRGLMLYIPLYLLRMYSYGSPCRKFGNLPNVYKK